MTVDGVNRKVHNTGVQACVRVTVCTWLDLYVCMYGRVYVNPVFAFNVYACVTCTCMRALNTPVCKTLSCITPLLLRPFIKGQRGEGVLA
jgi:hypothetical protein